MAQRKSKQKIVAEAEDQSSHTAQKNEAEERLRLAVEAGSDLIYEWEVGSDSLLWFGGIDEKLGYDPGEIPRTIEGWLDLIHPEDQEELRNAVERHRASIELIDEEYRIRHKDGSWKYWIDRGIPVLDQHGNPNKWIGACTDITLQRLAEINLRESEERYRTLFEYAGDAISVVDEDDHVLVVNPSMCELMGYSREELLSMRVPDLQAPDVRAEAGQAVRAEFERYGNSVFEVANIHRNGTRIPIELRLSKVAGPQGNLYYCIYRDISKRKQAENELREVFDTLTTVLESIDAHIYAADLKNYEILYMSKNMKEGFGGDFTGQTCFQAFRGEESVCSHCTNDKLLDEHGNPTGVHVWEGRNPLTNRWYINRDRAIRWHDGRLVRLQIATDITERKQAEETLQRHAEEMTTLHAVTLDLMKSSELDPILESIVARAAELLEGSSGGMYLCDAEKREARCVVSYQTPRDFTGTVLKYGEGAAGVVAETGRPLILDDYHVWEGRAEVFDGEESFRAMLSVPIVWQEQVKGVLHILRDDEGYKFSQVDLDLLMTLANHAAIAMENARLLQQIQRHADELEQRIDERTNELRKRVEEVEVLNRGMVNLMEDIQRANHQANIAANRLAVANEELEAFAYSVSHDLRAPLRGIRGFAEILAGRHRSDLNEQGREYLDFVVQAGDHMAELIDDLLEYSRLGRRAVRATPMDLELIIDEVLTSLSEIVRQNQAEIILPESYPVVMGDRTPLIQIFINLFDNALKYHRPDVPPTIELSWRGEADFAIIRVSDNGIGIPEEHRDRIFTMFQRLHGDEVPGTGIGLALVKKAVQLLSGDVQVVSAQGGGSTFIVKLPLPNGLGAAFNP